MEIKIELDSPLKIISVGGALLFFLGAFLPLYADTRADFLTMISTLVLAVIYTIASVFDKKGLALTIALAMSIFTGWVYFTILSAKGSYMEIFSNITSSSSNEEMSSFLDVMLQNQVDEEYALSIGFALLIIGSVMCLISALMAKKITKQ